MSKKYLLDTNICIYLLKGQRGIGEMIERVGTNNCYVSDITMAELWYGAANSGQRERQARGVKAIGKLFNTVSIHDTVELFGDNKALLKRQGTIIDDFDILIGSTAVLYDMIMVTENVKHLSRIPNIQIENWTK